MADALHSDEVILHAARTDEIDLAFQLANDDTVRSNSFTPDKISQETHNSWYPKIIKNPEALVLHAFIKKSFCGQVKFNCTANEALIGVSIVPDFRGRGLGAILLQKGIQQLQINNPAIKRIVALIKKENIASIRLFEKVGFAYSEMTVEKGFAACKYIYTII